MCLSSAKTYNAWYTSHDPHAAATSRSPSSASSRSATSRSTAWASRAAQASRDAYRAPSEGRGSREVWNQGREQTIDELMAPEAVAHGLADATQTHRGPTAFKPFWAQLRGAFPDIHFTIDDVVSEGDMVAARWTATMTHRGEYLGVAATQKQLTLTGMVFVRIGGGKIQEGWNNWDQHTVTRELGLPLR